MSKRQRGSTGKYAKNKYIDDFQYDQMTARYTPTARRNSIDKSPCSRKKLHMPISSIDLLKAENNEIIKDNCESIYFNAKVLTWIMWLIYFALKIVGWLALVMLIRIMLLETITGSLAKALFDCFKGSTAKSTCYSNIIDTLSTFNNEKDSFLLSFKISDSQYVGGKSIYELGLILSVRNPVIFAAAMILSMIGIIITAYFYNFAIKAAELADAADSNQNLKEKYGDIPKPI